MRAIQSPSTDPRFNLALEQYIFDQMPRNRSYLMLWRNDRTIVVASTRIPSPRSTPTMCGQPDSSGPPAVRGRGGLSRPGERELHLHRRPHGQRL